MNSPRLCALLILTLGGGGACRTSSRQQLGSSADSSISEAGGAPSLRQTLEEAGLSSDCPKSLVCLTILQLNDIYEIDALNGGTVAGLDRISTLRKSLASYREAGPVLTVLAGDFLSPSGLGLLVEDGRPWAGRQMVAVLKSAGLDYATFGNHEFDLRLSDLQDRLNESVRTNVSCVPSPPVLGSIATLAQNRDLSSRPASSRNIVAAHALPTLSDISLPSDQSSVALRCQKRTLSGGRAGAPCFEWLSTNVLNATAQSFVAGGQALPKARVLKIQRGELSVRLAMLGLTINDNPREYTKFVPVESSAQQLSQFLKAPNGPQTVDTVVALTHLPRLDDIDLLQKVPEIDLSMGGHDHFNSLDCLDETASERRRCVAKADSNGRSVYVHRLFWDPKKRQQRDFLTVVSKLINIDASIPRDAAVSAEIACWIKRGDQILAAQGSQKKLQTPVAKIPKPGMDATEIAVRRRSGSMFTEFVTKEMLAWAQQDATPHSLIHFAILQGGGIRIDDWIGPGILNYYDLVRIFPFSDQLVTVRIPLKDLARFVARAAREVPEGAGGILHIYPRVEGYIERPDAADLPAQILAELQALSGGLSADSLVGIITTDNLLSSGGELLPEEIAAFRQDERQTKKLAMRDFLGQILANRHPL